MGYELSKPLLRAELEADLKRLASQCSNVTKSVIWLLSTVSLMHLVTYRSRITKSLGASDCCIVILEWATRVHTLLWCHIYSKYVCTQNTQTFTWTWVRYWAIHLFYHAKYSILCTVGDGPALAVVAYVVCGFMLAIARQWMTSICHPKCSIISLTMQLVWYGSWSLWGWCWLLPGDWW